MAIEFYLNRLQAIKVENHPANTTVLQWLRSSNIVGTKEGCGSGDCGACMVVVAHAVQVNNGWKLQYDSLNACITLLGSLQGKLLITVEGLTNTRASPTCLSELHPVQQAMVNCHASQCGFCTPGFVMSLFAMHHSDVVASRKNIEYFLSGNLCRCTGYEPIFQATATALSNKKQDFFDQAKQEIIAKLLKINSQDTHLQNHTSIYSLPIELKQVLELKAANPHTRIVAGGTDFGLEVTQSYQVHPSIVQLSQIEELKQVKQTDNELKIGAAVTLEQAMPYLKKISLNGHKSDYKNIGNYLHRYASKPIRNIATVCGNITNASPVGDLPPLLLALGCQVELARLDSYRKVNLKEFYLDYRKTIMKQDELIVSITINKLKQHERVWVYKISKRFEDDISTVSIAIKLGFANNNGGELLKAVVAFGGMAAIPKIANILSNSLPSLWNAGFSDKQIYEAIATDFAPLTDMRGSAVYRRKVAVQCLHKCFAYYTKQHASTVTDIQYSDLA